MEAEKRKAKKDINTNKPKQPKNDNIVTFNIRTPYNYYFLSQDNYVKCDYPPLDTS